MGKPLKDKNKKNPPTPPTSGTDQHNELEQIPDDIKTKKSSITDPESGWFRKGEHKHVFAYAVETACDEHGWVLDIVFILEMNMTAEHFKQSMKR